MRRLLTLSSILLLSIFVACSGATAPRNDGGPKQQESPKDLPEGLNTKPVEEGTSPTPGIPDPKDPAANEVPKGTTPTPGIPDPKQLGKPLPKGATPTPGIPDPETLKRQMNRKRKDIENVNRKGESKSSRKDPLGRPRKVNN